MGLFLGEDRFDDAHTRIEHAMSHTVNQAYHLGYAVEAQAGIWYKQQRLEEVRSGVLRAADILEKLGAAGDLERCRRHLQWIDEEPQRVRLPLVGLASVVHVSFCKSCCLLYVLNINVLPSAQGTKRFYRRLR